VLVIGQFLTGTWGCSQWTLLRSNAEGLGSIVFAVVDVSEVVVVDVSEVVVVDVSEVVVVVVVLVSATPDEDLLEEHSKGQHHISEQPLSGNTTIKSTPKRSIIAIRFPSKNPCNCKLSTADN
jgi:hypothetical protein